ncbi:MAG: quinate 5-dehydrogenase [Candidatus Heimdallarchaeaceae archaeon]
MKKVISVSLGSKHRDYTREFTLGGEKIQVQRIGTDGDWKKYQELLEYYDGKIDAFGVGGVDCYLWRGSHKYKIRDFWKISKNVKETPLIDGGGIKNTLEGKIFQYIEEKLPEEVEGDRSTVVMSAVDRWGQASSAWEFVNKNKKLITFGDLIWGLKLGIPIHSLKTVNLIGFFLMPVVSRMPFTMLYPTGEEQKVHKPYKTKYFKKAKFIAGDYLFINRNMPNEDMEGKIIITNTTTEENMERLRDLGIKYVITSTPRIEGRSFGTNVLEASIVAVSGKKRPLTTEEYNHYLKEFNIEPVIEKL